MPLIANKGTPDADIWFVVERPFGNDTNKGYLYSSGLGYMWDKLVQEAGVGRYFVTCVFPDTDNYFAARSIIGEAQHWQPRIIIPLDTAGRHFCPELLPSRRTKTYNEEKDSEIFKYAGSILTCDKLNFPHYIIPTLAPDLIARQYKLKEQVQLDIAKAVAELEYFKQNGILQPLPQRKLQIDFESFDEQLHILDSFCDYKYISNDIETIYPRKGSAKNPSQFYGKHPGYPITVGLAPSKDFGISIDLFREKPSENIELWRKLDKLFKNTIQIGQNFFNFDLNFYEMLGFRFRVSEIQDTMIRHHVLWPELPHKLQHLTRQYTREAYYKDEGHGWSMKDMRKLKTYNCKDVCITYEVFEEQEKEFDERPHLR